MLERCRTAREAIRLADELTSVERTALALDEKDPESARAFLTSFSGNFARAVTQKYWELGDQLWDLFARNFFFTQDQLKAYR